MLFSVGELSLECVVKMSIESSVSSTNASRLADRDVLNLDFEGTGFALGHHDSKMLDVSAIEGEARFLEVASVGEVELIKGDDYIAPLANFFV